MFWISESTQSLWIPAIWFALVFYCCATNCLKLSSLKQYLFDDLKVSVGPKSRQWYNWVLCARSHEAEIKMFAGCALIQSSGSCSKLIQADGRIQVLRIVGLRSLLPHQLSPEGLSQLLEAALSSWPCGSLTAWQHPSSRLAETLLEL